MNALAHCVDAFPLRTLSPLVARTAIDSSRIIGNNLAGMIADPSNLDARNELLYAAYLAGALLSGGFALQHDIAHVLGGSLGVEHGLAHAIVLPHVAEYHMEYAGQSLQSIAAALGRDRLDHAIFDLLVTSGLPTSLQQVGLTRTDLDRALQIVISPDHAPYPNPAPVTAEAVGRILTRSFEGRRPE
jgi:alcohol dehydrogenase class IV